MMPRRPLLTLKRLLHEIRFVPQKLWRHRVVSAIRIAVGGVAFVTVVFTAYYALQAYLNQQQAVSESSLRRLEIQVVQYNDLEARLTTARIRELTADSRIEFGYPQKQVSAELQLGQRNHLVTLRGIVGREPELLGGNLLWQRPAPRPVAPTAPAAKRSRTSANRPAAAAAVPTLDFPAGGGLVLSLDTFQRLGGKLSRQGPSPDRLAVAITRSTGEATETQRFELPVTGILRRSESVVFAPLELTIQLDRWQTHKSDTPRGRSQSPRQLDYDYLDAYVPAAYVDDVAREEAQFGVQATPVRELTLREFTGPVWAQVRVDGAPDNLPFAPETPRTRSAESRLTVLSHLAQRLAAAEDLGCRVHPVWQFTPATSNTATSNTATSNTATANSAPNACLILEDDDPRWALNGLALRAGEVLGRGETLLFATPPRHGSLPAALTALPPTDYLTSRSNALRLDFRPERSRVTEDWWLLETTSTDVARQWEQTYRSSVQADVTTAWTVARWAGDSARPPLPAAQLAADSRTSRAVDPSALRIDPLRELLLPAEPQPNLPEASRPEPSPPQAGSVSPRVFGPQPSPFPPAPGPGRRTRLRVRFLPLEVLVEVAGWAGQSRGTDLPLVVTRDARDTPQLAALRDQLAARQCRVAARTLDQHGLEAWLPVQLQQSLEQAHGLRAREVGFVARGDWREVAALEARVQTQAPAPECVTLARRFPRRYSTLVPQAVAPARPAAHPAPEQREREVTVLPLPVRLGGRELARWVLTIPDRRVAASTVCAAGELKELPPAATFPELLGQRYQVVRDWQIPPGFLWLPHSTFHELAFRKSLVAGKPEPPGALQLHLEFAEAAGFFSAERRVAHWGHSLTPLTPQRVQSMTRYRVTEQLPRDSDPANGTQPSLSRQKAQQLVMAKPTFALTLPRIVSEIRVGSESLRLVSHHGAEDPLWQQFPLSCGRAGNSPRTVYLPRQAAERIFPGVPLDDLPGRPINLKLSQEGRREGIAVPCRIGGIVDGEAAYAASQDVAHAKLWSQGKLVFDQAHHKFQSLEEVYEQRGFLGAVLYASSERAVPALVDDLKAAGFDVRHQLDQQRQLLRLGLALLLLVVLFVSGAILNAMFNSGAVSWMDLSTRMKEIGIKLAYGLTRTDIALAYTLEGALVGLLSSAFGGLIVLLLAAPLRALLCRTMGMPDEFFVVEIHSPTVLWLYLAAAVVVVLFNVLGGWVPTWLALRKSPVELLNS